MLNGVLGFPQISPRWALAASLAISASGVREITAKTADFMCNLWSLEQQGRPSRRADSSCRHHASDYQEKNVMIGYLHQHHRNGDWSAAQERYIHRHRS
jgi:hypothetical protein